MLIRDFFSVAWRRQLEVHIKSLSASNEICLIQPRKIQLTQKRMQLLSQGKKEKRGGRRIHVKRWIMKGWSCRAWVWTWLKRNILVSSRDLKQAQSLARPSLGPRHRSPSPLGKAEPICLPSCRRWPMVVLGPGNQRIRSLGVRPRGY